MTTETHYLNIHFAPNTASVAIQLSEHQAEIMKDAMSRHQGEIKLRMSAHQEITTMVKVVS